MEVRLHQWGPELCTGGRNLNILKVLTEPVRKQVLTTKQCFQQVTFIAGRLQKRLEANK